MNDTIPNNDILILFDEVKVSEAMVEKKDTLRLCIKYLLLDLEATERERDYFIAKSVGGKSDA